MAEFQDPFFTSTSEDVEAEYVCGVEALRAGDCNAASRHLGNAARGGHVSALFNLSLLWGSGSVTPYDFDLAADCWYKAAEAGHPRAKAILWQLEAADRGGFGANNLAKFAKDANSGDSLIYSIMVCAARFYDVICRKYGATVDVIAYELDTATMSNFDFVHSFVKRTGINKDFYEGGLNRLKPDSAADQIVDGLNQLHAAMRSSGVSEKLAAMARCSIVGHIIAKSPYGEHSQPLRGIDTFFIEDAGLLAESRESHANEMDLSARKRESQVEQTQRQIAVNLEQMGASVLLITQSGKVVMTADSLQDRPRNWFGGKVMEVMISRPGLAPYFIYYENDEYYYNMSGPAQQSFSNAQGYNNYRSNVSQALCMYLVVHLIATQGNDISHPEMSFSHNRIHTNVIAYVDKLNNWYPIQHNSAESNSATERKVAQVNRGEIDITDVIAVHHTSPS
ncbi:hypothetical protein V1954_12400 [Yersinia sp. 2538 StPb PI]|uniref:hypothetical protein n=1 Tax=unclassified Yersinia (in: enterobacteria) TaxID=2653513 RepID=UPI00355C364F